MASYKEKLSFVESQEIMMTLCNTAATALGWRVVSMDRTKLQIRETAVQGQNIQIPTQIEVKVLPLSDGCGLELSASSVGFGAAATQRVQGHVQAFINQIRFELDRPNMQRRKEEEDHLKELEKQRKREIEERAEAEEAAQRAAARELIMQQLKGGTASKLGLASQPPATKDGEQHHHDTDTSEARNASPEPPPPPREPVTLSRYAPAGAKPPPEPASTGDMVAGLERLASLHQMGALSDEEFSAAKRKLLRL